MSILKRAWYQGERDGEPLVRVVQPGEMEKTASEMVPEVQDFISKLTPDPKYTYVLLNAMGYSEYFGANSNKDYYGYNPHLSFNGLLNAPPDWGADPCKDMAAGKKWMFGYPTYYGASVYAHHKNTCPKTLGFGDVMFVMPNHKMKRIELVNRVDNHLAHERGRTSILNRIRNHDRVDVSMGCKVPFDLCSICTDWAAVQTAWDTFNPGKHAHPGIAILHYHRGVAPITGLSVTRADYCFPAGTLIQMASGEQRPIEEIRVGDEVLTHTGASKKVLCLLPREDTHIPAVCVRAWGIQDQVATANHPYRVFRGMRTGVHGGRVAQMDQAEPQWIPAEELETSDVVLRPIPSLGNGGASTDLGWLLGMYLAEGSPNYSQGCDWPKSVTLTLHKKETAWVSRLWGAALELDKDASHSIYEYPDRAAIDVRISSRIVAEWLTHMGGCGSRSKKMAPGVFLQGELFARGVLAGWADGDGSVGKAGLRIATSSECLAMQGQDLAARLGVLCAIQRYDRVSNYGPQTIWYLGFSGDAAVAVAELRPQQEFSKQSKLFFWNGNLCTSIRGVNIIDDLPDVYNFEVEEDNSYIAGGLAVHNCEHMRKIPGQILSDGRKVFVYNDFPRFFDISFVWIGADKTARVMWFLDDKKPDMDVQKTEIIPGPITVVRQNRVVVKTAMEKRAGDAIFFKHGEIEKEIPGGFAKKIELHAMQEPDLPFDILGDASEKFGPKSLLSTLAALGIVLKPREFHIVVTKGRPMSEKLASLAIAQGSEFDTTTSKVDDKHAVSGDNVNPELAKVFQPATGARSSFAPHLGSRVRGPTPRDSILKKESSVLRSEVMNELASQYNGYRLSVLEQAPTIFPKYASLAGGPVGGGFLGEAATSGRSLPSGVAPLLLGLGPVIHLVSAHLRRKQRAGEDLGIMSKFVAENPTFTSLATIGVGLRAAMGVQKAGGLGSAAKGVVSALRAVA